MKNVKLVIEYDGTNFVGWQRQLNGKSVQGEIETMLKRILQEEVSVIGAGRTDAGVHARGQVANFRTSSDLSAREIRSGLNGLLPEDIVVHAAEEVPFEFHSRFDAKERDYSYTISLRPAAMMRGYCWQMNYKLDMELLGRTAEHLIGEHDFESFCKSNSEVDHFRCEVKRSEWVMKDGFLLFNIGANRFLHGMVRALVGTMVGVARGLYSYEQFISIFEKKNRSEAGVAAPARGLVLENIVY